MTKILQDIYIINKDGLCLFERHYSEKMDPHLFSGFITALNTVASQLGEEKGLTNFTLGDNKYILIKHNNLLFVGNYNNKVGVKKAYKELEKVVNIFFSVYSFDDIMNWNGDADFFSGFEEHIKDSLESVAKKFEDSFW
ncbi:MAG: hypothetical protein ACTSRA_10720 [Promethearchaeota archaeon]